MYLYTGLVFLIYGYCAVVTQLTSKFYQVKLEKIYEWLEPSIDISNCQFEENSAMEADGGAIEIAGSVGSSDYMSISIENSSFTNNSALYGYGGAISRLQSRFK